MTWVMAFALWCTLATGVYLLLSRDLLRCLFGLMMMGSAGNLLVFMSGRVGSALPPVVAAPAQALTSQDANPVPQALVLTAIVIGFTLACFLMLLAVALLRTGASDDADAIRDAEPPATDPVKPPYAADALQPVVLSQAAQAATPHATAQEGQA
ncbi:MAG: NADH-quinone oxidoreductase subunit K [Brachymonas sp.]|nr:NADH-quinone oxidoreductase subunit K [Brachymonas sp.]